MKHKKGLTILLVVLFLSLSVGGAAYYCYETMTSVESPTGQEYEDDNFFQKYMRAFYDKLQN